MLFYFSAVEDWFCCVKTYELYYQEGPNCLLLFFWLQINEEASDKVLEVEQKYNEIRKPIYDKRNDIIKFIPDFWLTAVSALTSSICS